MGSIQCLRIVQVKSAEKGIDYDLTIEVPNIILSPLNGDYDGDTLNLVSLKDTRLKELYRSVLSPKNLLLDPATGNINKALLLERDQIIALNELLH